MAMSSSHNGLTLLLFLFSASLVSRSGQSTGSPVQGQRTLERSDPLRGFEHYEGTYDVRDKHYWASTAFTGVHGYGIAGIWILCGIGFGVFLIVVKNQRTTKRWIIKDFLDHHYLLVFYMILLFTFLAIVASSFVLLANQRTVTTMERLKGTILGIGYEARISIERITKAMTQMQLLLLPYDQAMAQTLTVTAHRLGNESRIIRSYVDKNGRAVDRAIQASYVAHIVVVTTNLLLIIAALVLILFHWYQGFLFVIFLCWILTSLCWVLTGFDFFLHTFAEDTCFAFEDFERNPQTSSLGAMVHCMNNSYSDQMMVQVGFIVHTFINQLNSKILEYYRLVRLDGGQSYEYMYSGFVNICNPFNGAPNYNYVPQSCPKNAIPIAHLPNILSSFTCYEGEKERCKSNGKFVTEAVYNMASAYSRSTQDLLDVIPDLQRLSQCKLVKDKFSYVVSHECAPFRDAVQILWSSMLSLSIFMSVLVLIWVAKCVQDCRRQFSLCSSTPRPLDRS